jgi:hypothetical protein
LKRRGSIVGKIFRILTIIVFLYLMISVLIDMDARGARDEFFKRYFWYWRDHPEYQPAYFSLLSEAVPAIRKDGKFDKEVLDSLDMEAGKRGEKVLFSPADASIDFWKFYHDVLRVPLNRDIERGADGAKLSAYFEFEELSKIPDIRVYGREKVNAAERDIAIELSHWLGKITSEKISEDIIEALNHYDEAIIRTNAGSSFVGQFGHVKLLASPPLHSVAQDVLLMPRRSYGVIEEGYEGVLYPTFVISQLNGQG